MEDTPMPMSIRQVGPCFAGEVAGIDLTKPITPDAAAAIHAGMDEFGVLVFHDQAFTDETQVAFTESLGKIEHSIGASLRKPGEYRLPTTFADVSNLDKENKVYQREDRRRLFAIGNRLWHSDSSFKPVPAKYSLLHARAIPDRDGNTEFADMRTAYDALDDKTKTEIEGMICRHSQIFSRKSVGFEAFDEEERIRMAPVRQRLVRTHPSTGRQSLYLSSHAGEIENLPLPEAMLLLKDLTEHATQRQFVYPHEWRTNDLVIWDNRRLMHRARPFPEDQPRDMRRTTLIGDGPTVEQMHVA
jgi:alpha-ketoglutarate-dependent 2,4-dichlorophenoxyacetate dioxygenase